MRGGHGGADGEVGAADVDGEDAVEIGGVAGGDADGGAEHAGGGDEDAAGRRRWAGARGW